MRKTSAIHTKCQRQQRVRRRGFVLLVVTVVQVAPEVQAVAAAM